MYFTIILKAEKIFKRTNSLKKKNDTALKNQKLEKGDGEGNGTPLQYSRLENPMDGGAW